MTNAEEIQVALVKSCNADGGWPSHRGCSWTEPTALALLALQGAVVPGEVRSSAASWLVQHQSTDGGWPPCAAVPTSTWVTSLALLALTHERKNSESCLKGVRWLSSQVYPELGALQDFLQSTLGISPSRAPGSAPWFPGTAGWIIPTAFSILALSRWSEQMQQPTLISTVRRAQDYLLSRRCADGGWNHGGSAQRSETAPSYPETTGLALLALHSHRSHDLEPTLRRAEELFQKPDSTEGLCWLLMGLAAHGIRKEESPWPYRSHKTQDIALQLITTQALLGRNPFLNTAT